MEFTADQIVKIILAITGLITVIFGAIFTVNKRSHKTGNINGSNNKVINGDFTKKSNNKK